MAVVTMKFGAEWRARLDAGERDVMARIAPQILDVQRRAVPVLTGELLDSLDSRIVDGPDGRPVLQIGSLAGPSRPRGVPYCLAVEFGFHGIEHVRAHLRQGHPVRAHDRQGNVPEQPYIRPSAYRRYAP